MGIHDKTFIQLADEIAVARAEVAEHVLNRHIARINLTEREYAIMSVTDYAALGKNEGERSTAKERLFRADAAWSKAQEDLQAAEIGLMGCEVHLETLRDIRRGMEWDLRALMVATSMGAGDAPAGSDAEKDDLPFTVNGGA